MEEYSGITLAHMMNIEEAVSRNISALADALRTSEDQAAELIYPFEEARQAMRHQTREVMGSLEPVDLKELEVVAAMTDIEQILVARTLDAILRIQSMADDAIENLPINLIQRARFEADIREIDKILMGGYRQEQGEKVEGDDENLVPSHVTTEAYSRAIFIPDTLREAQILATTKQKELSDEDLVSIRNAQHRVR